jgi:SPP1 family predicted phage head-tail adaptor
MVGNLDKWIDLQYQARVADGKGGSVVTWISVLAAGQLIAASIWPIIAVEKSTGTETTMIATHTIRIRYRSVLNPNWRIVFAGKNYNIVSIADFRMKHRWLDIKVKENR